MATRYLIKETAPFVQFSSVKVTDAFNALFDIEKVPEESLETYCQALFTKAFNQNNSNIPDFLNHHCSLVKDPMLWLNKFEKLISENEEIFHEAKRDSKLIKFQTCIEFKRNELKLSSSSIKHQKPPKRKINAESEERYFSFFELKQQLTELSDPDEKIILLTDEKYEYQQSSIDFINRTLPNYDEQCEKEIEHILARKKLDEQKKSTEDHKKSTVDFSQKIKTNLKVNQLVDIFIQLQREIFIESRPAIEAENSEIVQFICNSFTDKDGNEISPQTVKTIMMPSKPEKRPKGSNKLDVTDWL